jgi:hypothetical protein
MARRIISFPACVQDEDGDWVSSTVSINIIDFPVVSLTEGPWLYDGDQAQTVVKISNGESLTVCGSVESITNQINTFYES